MIKEKVLIFGICKDVASRLPRSIKIVEKIGSLFEDYRIHVYENNSVDGTKEILSNWHSHNLKLTIESEDINETDLYVNKDFLKSNGTSRARNKVMKKLHTFPNDFEYVIWIDLDFVIEPNYGGFIEIFERPEKEWDAIFSYGTDPDGFYWDWLPFRDSIYPLGPELIGHNEWFVKKKDLGLTREDLWYPVYSAFGGCGIYRREAISGCVYAAEVSKDMEMVWKNIITKNAWNPQVSQYLNKWDRKKSEYLENIGHIRTGQELPNNKNYDKGWVIDNGDLLWRMNNFTGNFPSVCDHVPVHASMILRGYDRLFINPRLEFHYGG